jgi:hypothetical protein
MRVEGEKSRRVSEMYKIQIPEREIEEGDKKGESRTRVEQESDRGKKVEADERGIQDWNIKNLKDRERGQEGREGTRW